MADRTVDHLLIGGGQASANCARWLREAGGDGSILLVGREPEPPYERPPLTKEYLRGEKTRADAYFRPDEWWGEQNIELLKSVSVTQLDAKAKTAALSSGEEVAFETALIATGANVRRIHADGMGLDGIHYLRAFGNADDLLKDLDHLGKRVTLIGGSYIGCEVAASLTKIGAKCTIVMMEDQPLERTLGPEVGTWVGEQLRAEGIEIHGGQKLERFEGDGDDQAPVRRVVTDQGLTVDTDVVVIGAGVMPEVSLAEQAGLTIGERHGILCDSHLQSSVPGIYAAGDVCEYDSPFHDGTIRVEHWDVAFNQGKTVALNMLGQPTVHEVVPYFWSELGGFEIESVGPAYGWDEVVIRGSMADRDFSAWYIADGHVAQVVAVGRSGDIEAGTKLLAARATAPEPAKLADDAFEPATLA